MKITWDKKFTTTYIFPASYFWRPLLFFLDESDLIQWLSVTLKSLPCRAKSWNVGICSYPGFICQNGTMEFWVSVGSLRQNLACSDIYGPFSLLLSWFRNHELLNIKLLSTKLYISQLWRSCVCMQMHCVCTWKSCKKQRVMPKSGVTKTLTFEN